MDKPKITSLKKMLKIIKEGVDSTTTQLKMAKDELTAFVAVISRVETRADKVESLEELFFYKDEMLTISEAQKNHFSKYTLKKIAQMFDEIEAIMYQSHDLKNFWKSLGRYEARTYWGYRAKFTELDANLKNLEVANNMFATRLAQVFKTSILPVDKAKYFEQQYCLMNEEITKALRLNQIHAAGLNYKGPEAEG